MTHEKKIYKNVNYPNGIFVASKHIPLAKYGVFRCSILAYLILKHYNNVFLKK